MLSAKNIRKSYGELSVLKGIDLEVAQGELLSIVGASGSGKSTLLQIIGTLDKADQGEIFIKGTNIGQLRRNQLALFRNRHIGFVFQFHNLLPEFTAQENVALPALLANLPFKEAQKKAADLLEKLGLSDRMTHKPAALSGGEQQRIAVARALVNNPSIVFADEPSGNLDSATAEHLHQLFSELRKSLNQTFVVVTHNLKWAKTADRMLEIKDGKIL